MMEICNKDSFTKESLGDDLEQVLSALVYPANLYYFFEFQQSKQLDKYLLVFVKSWCSSLTQRRICSISTGLYQRSHSSKTLVTPIAADEYIQREKIVHENNEVIQFYERNSVNLDECLKFGESVTVEFKDFSGNAILNRLKETLPMYVSAFANTGGGFLFIGIDDSGTVTGCGKGKDWETLRKRVLEICETKVTKVHRKSCSKPSKRIVECRIIKVQEADSCVLGINIPAFCCLAFEEQPDSWQIKDSKLDRFTAEEWLDIMDSTDSGT